jgi:hypothetical protein
MYQVAIPRVIDRTDMASFAGAASTSKSSRWRRKRLIGAGNPERAMRVLLVGRNEAA